MGIMGWIASNMEWLFSGAGILVLTFLVKVLVSKSKERANDPSVNVSNIDRRDGLRVDNSVKIVGGDNIEGDYYNDLKKNKIYNIRN